MKAIECFSSKEDKGIDINSPNQTSFEKTISSIQMSLHSKSKPRKMFIVALIISTIKGFLNLFHLRISSKNLYKNIDLIRKNFFIANWNQYLKDYCDITANCDLDKAKIIFIGDQHADYYQNILRQNLITHYAGEDQIAENLVLLEGLDTDDFPKNLDNKKFTVKSWESKEHWQELGKVTGENCKLFKDMNVELKNFENLKNNKSISLRDKKKMLIELLDKIEKTTTLFDITQKECEKLHKKRNNDLIDNVKISASKRDRKIFAIAGSKHLLLNDYKIIDSFNDFPCAVIIPKVSQLGEQNAGKVVQNIIRLGTYDEAYENI